MSKPASEWNHTITDRSHFDLVSLEGEMRECELFDMKIGEMSREDIYNLCMCVVKSHTPIHREMPYLVSRSDGRGEVLKSQTLVVPTTAPRELQPHLTEGATERLLLTLGASTETLMNYGVIPHPRLPMHKSDGMSPEHVLDEYPKFCERCCGAWNKEKHHCISGLFKYQNAPVCHWKKEDIIKTIKEWVKRSKRGTW